MSIPLITTLPAAPQRTDDPTTFANKADTFLAALPGMVTEENAAITEMNNVAAQVDADATSAANSASAASTSEGNAATSETNAGNAESGALAAQSVAEAAQALAEAALDNFDDRYLGAKSSDPTTDNDGDALLTGALYWNTSAGNLRVYNGSTWVVISLYVHPNHSGDVTSSGDGATTLQVAAITGKPALGSGLAATDELLINDGGVLKRMQIHVLQEQYLRSSTTGNKSVSGNPYLAEQTLTDGATISWNISNGAEAKATLGGNRTLDATAIPPAGTWCSFLAIQDGTGNRTLAYSADFDFGDAGSPTLSTAAGAEDLLSFRSNGIKLQFMGIAQGFA